MTPGEHLAQMKRWVSNKVNTRDQIAIIYAESLAEVDHNHPHFWRESNEVILSRWSRSGLEYIKKQAWKRFEALS